MRTTWMMLAIAVLPGMLSLLAAESTSLPLPPPDSLLERVLERAQQEELEQRRFKECYGYTRTRVTEYRNSDGDLKKRKAKTRVNNPTLIPVAYYPQRNAGRELVAVSDHSKQVSVMRTNESGRAFEKSDFPLNEDLLKRFDFTLSGREVINGRPALVVDFKPARRQPPEKSIKDRFINKAAGRVWVDEVDYALVKASLHLSERVNVIGGLVGAVSKFTLAIERQRTPEGLWFIRRQNWHLEGREVIVHRKVDFHEEYKDVRKVNEPESILFR